MPRHPVAPGLSSKVLPALRLCKTKVGCLSRPLTPHFLSGEAGYGGIEQQQGSCPRETPSGTGTVTGRPPFSAQWCPFSSHLHHPPKHCPAPAGVTVSHVS